jgi:hypothetical protein
MTCQVADEGHRPLLVGEDVPIRWQAATIARGAEKTQRQGGHRPAGAPAEGQPKGEQSRRQG